MFAVSCKPDEKMQSANTKHANDVRVWVCIFSEKEK